MSSSSSNVTLHPIRTRASSSSSEFRLCSGRLSSSESEFPMMVESSCLDDIYYKESSVRVGVPFLWESRPGTPKIKSKQYPLPPLTPPPSFHATPTPTPTPTPINIISPKRPSKKQSRITLKRIQHSPSWSTASSPLNDSNRFRVNEDECESPVSTLCFGGARRSRSSPGCSSAIIRLC